MQPAKHVPSLNRNALQIGVVPRASNLDKGVKSFSNRRQLRFGRQQIVGMNTFLGWLQCAANIFAATLENSTTEQQRFLS